MAITEWLNFKNNLNRLGVPKKDENGNDLTIWEQVYYLVQYRDKFDFSLAKPIDSQGVDAKDNWLDDAIPANAIKDVMGYSKVIDVVPNSVALTVPAEPKTLDYASNLPFKLTNDQDNAWEKIQNWVNFTSSTDPFFVLKGPAGTGKSTLLRMLASLDKTSVNYTATTNKAAKELGKHLDGAPTKTIHSLLGLRMEQREDKLVLSIPKRRPMIKPGTLVAVDECSMVGPDLLKILKDAVELYKIKVIFSGDSYQLNPIGYRTSDVWKITSNSENKATLNEVVRFGDSLLELAKRIRKVIKNRDWDADIPIYSDNNGVDRGVWDLDETAFRKSLLKEATDPLVFKDTKVICWRNKTVDYWNKLIRKKLGFTKKFEVGDILMLAAPYTDEDETILAHIDDEGVVLECNEGVYRVDGIDIQVYFVLLDLGEQRLSLRIPVDTDGMLDKYLTMLSKNARECRKDYDRVLSWKKYWTVRNKFHKVRYGYAGTCHRYQGSTLRCTYSNVSDFMANPDKAEAWRCLVTGTSRATTRMVCM